MLSSAFSREIDAEELYAYACGLLSWGEYTTRFWDALTVPGAHLPITRDPALFERVSDHGRRLLDLRTVALHDMNLSQVASPGAAKFSKAIPATRYPEAFSNGARSGTLTVGEGEYTDVPNAVWDYKVSGPQIVKSWLSYRS